MREARARGGGGAPAPVTVTTTASLFIGAFALLDCGAASGPAVRAGVGGSSAPEIAIARGGDATRGEVFCRFIGRPGASVAGIGRSPVGSSDRRGLAHRQPNPAHL